MPKVLDKILYKMLTGANRRDRTKGAGWATCWFSGCGTIRGAGSRFLLREEDGREDEKPFMSTSCRLMSVGGGPLSMASATGSAGSPSKKRDIAIYNIR